MKVRTFYFEWEDPSSSLCGTSFSPNLGSFYRICLYFFYQQNYNWKLCTHFMKVFRTNKHGSGIMVSTFVPNPKIRVQVSVQPGSLRILETFHRVQLYSLLPAGLQLEALRILDKGLQFVKTWFCGVMVTTLHVEYEDPSFSLGLISVSLKFRIVLVSPTLLDFTSRLTAGSTAPTYWRSSGRRRMVLWCNG